MKKITKIFSYYLFLALFVFLSLGYASLLITGRNVYSMRSIEVQRLYDKYPNDFSTIFTSIIPLAVMCENSGESCESSIKQKFLALFDTSSEDNAYQVSGGESVLNKPMYFIQLQQNREIVKVFFSGNVKVEQIDTRSEMKVRELLQGERETLYGPYFNSEAFLTLNEAGGTESNKRIFKPTYLNDLYSQAEVIVPFKHDGKLIGATVWLHGE
ncbi:MAG: hypothetical protein WAU07_05530 [Microgenomates group bacterium]